MENEFYHTGIKGQKKGVRRFQYENGTLTPEGRIRYAKYLNKDGTGLSRKGKRKLKKINKQDAKRKMEEQRKAEANRKKVEQGDVMYIMEHINDFTNEELKRASDRYYNMDLLYGNAEKEARRLNKIKKQNAKKSPITADNIIKFMNKGNKFMETAIDSANISTRIINTLLDEDFNYIPIIEKNNKSKRKKNK